MVNNNMEVAGERRTASGKGNNSAPSNRMLRVEGLARMGSLSSLREIQFEEAKLIEIRSRKVTVCLICLIASISCLSPFVSLHLTQRVGLLLFESDLIQLRSSLYTVIICLLVLVIIYAILFFNRFKPERRSLIIQKLFKQLLGFFAIISAISYLSIVLIVPQIRQIQRMPLATFDCNANLITIENCQQQFTTKGGEQTLTEAVNELLLGDLNGNSERLIKKLNCLKYNDKELDALQVPTRFLLHKCGLVCKTQRQQLHQFNDDMNRDQNNQQDWSTTTPGSLKVPADHTKFLLENAADSSSQSKQHRPLVPPYHDDLVETQNRGRYLNHLTYTHNASSPQAQDENFHPSTKAIYESLNTDNDSQANSQQQVSLKVCFSGEFSGGPNYKQFCITNLANNGHSQDHTLTVRQLNAMLRKFMPTSGDLTTTNLSQDTPGAARSTPLNYDQYSEADQSTQYMNPVVQFESHFRNWPQLSRSTLSQQFSSGTSSEEVIDNQDGWCSFRPIPPFIVNNKPFSDIQCSLEHEYTMTTGPSLDSVSFSGRGADKIYLKKSSLDSGEAGGGITRERCNIQCKVNILYQVHMSNSADGITSRKRSSRRDLTKETISEDTEESTKNNADDDLHYYLPLKPCLIVSDEADKASASHYYLLFRTIGDTTLILVFILLDIFLFLESIDTRQFQLEAKKVRLISLLLVVALIPLLISLLFDLISVYYPNQFNNKARKEGYLTAFLNDQVIPNFVDFFSSSTSSSNTKTRRLQTSVDQSTYKTTTLNYSSLGPNKFVNESDTSSNIKRTPTYQLDNYMLPFFFYCTFMFTLAINSFTLPLIPSVAQLVRVSSTEELGMAPSKIERSGKSSSNRKKQTPNLANIQSDNLSKQFKQLYKKQTGKLISLSLIALFMGTQFNLSQLTQTHLLIESFGHSTGNSLQNMQSFASFWFALRTHSSAAIFVLLIALLFIEETSAFFGGLSPFKVATSAYSTNEESRRGRAKFLNYMTISLLIYSLRYYSLANLSFESSFKWLVIFLFQLAELFNFPLTWFALTMRAHEILVEYRARHKLLANSRSPLPETDVERQNKNQSKTGSSSSINQQVSTSKHSPESRAKSIALHILVQSTAAFIYFVLARSVALFAHSLNASLHLHSDNVDWFITSFHQNQHQHQQQYQNQQAVHNNNRRREQSSSNIEASIMAKQNVTVNGQQQQQQHSQPSSIPPPMASNTGKLPPESLFSPLPGERQTYLHASRLFLRYNSLMCLLIGLLLLAALIYVKYQIWADQRRTLEVYQPADGAEQAADESSIGDRLSLDLMRIHSSGPTRTIYPEPSNRPPTSATTDKPLTRPQSPRAKILFHYNLGRKDSSLSSSSITSATSPNTLADSRRGQVARKRDQIADTAQTNAKRGSFNELRIPIEMAQEEEQEEDEDMEPMRGQIVERITKHRNKRVRIFEDSESWPNEEEEIGLDLNDDSRYQQQKQSPVDMSRLDQTTSKRSQHQQQQQQQQQPKPAERNRKRSISFAPTATLIGNDGALSERKRSRSDDIKITVQRASPEPSIDDNQSEFEVMDSD